MLLDSSSSLKYLFRKRKIVYKSELIYIVFNEMCVIVSILIYYMTRKYLS